MNVELSGSIWAWAGLLGLILGLLILDLMVFHRTSRQLSIREAAVYSMVWILVGIAFGALVWVMQSSAAAIDYFTGYLVEKSLSLDNVFLWSVIFTYFKVPAEQHHRVLFWGVFGALTFRAAFIFAGVALMESVEWVIYLFGVFLLFMAFRVGRRGTDEIEPERNPIIRLMRRVIPVTRDFEGQHFIVRRPEGWVITPLLTVLVVIELTDIVFAVDSVPAILSITSDTFIVFSSNAFAVLGLRALYFLLHGVKKHIRYLHQGLAVILAFVGLKFLLSNVVHVPGWTSLLFVVAVMTITVVVSRGRANAAN